MPTAVPPPESDPCDICGANAFEPWLEVSVCRVADRWIHRCRRCGFRQVRPRLTRQELPSLYPAGYFDQHEAVGYVDYAREAQRRERDAYFLAGRVRRHGQTSRVLEVGCALGFLLAGLRRAGFDVRGVDASPFAAHYATTKLQLPVVCGTLEEACYPDGCFDVVIQKDLLEHTLHPREHLRETARVMRAGAELWLLTPNGEANLRPLTNTTRRRSESRDDRLPLLDQGHLSFFSRAHLRRLFDECGLEVRRERVIGVRRGLRALGWWPGQGRFLTMVARSTGSRGRVAASDTSDFDSQADRIARDVEARERWLRGWPPYFYLHRLGKRLDALPASTGVGYDFEFVLRKR